MKKIIIVHALLLISLGAYAQQPNHKKPAASPEAAFTQQFGESEIQVQYARPSAKGRKIFGGLVPFDSLWRTGAGDCTTITFKEDVMIGDKKMGAGKYSLFTIPRPNDWTIVLNSDVSMHGTMGYDSQKDVHRFIAKSAKTDRFYETFTIEINDFTPQGEASLNIIWENTMAKIPLKRPLFMTDETTVKKEVASKVETAKTVETTQTTVLENHDMTKMQNKGDVHAVDLKAQFAPVLLAYFDLKNALVADNAVLAASKGKEMKSALLTIETKDWTIQQRNVYETLSKKLETDAEHIGENASKIDHQREHFISLSNNISTLTKTFKLNTETEFLLFCPMANNGKGAYWLSKEDKIRNPYYGKQMLTCGSVKETIK